LPEQAAAVVAVAALPEQAAAVVAVAALPDSAAVIVPAVKFPLASLATMAFAVFADVADVAVLATFPGVVIVASFVSEIAAPVAMSAFVTSEIVAASTIECSAAGVTSSPLIKVFPFVMVAIKF